MSRIRLTRWHWGAVLLLLAELAVAALVLVPRPSAAYRAQFIDRVDCWHAEQGGSYHLGDTVHPRFDTPEAGPDGIFACGWLTLDDGAWSLGGAAHLYFRLPPESGQLRLELVARALVSPSHPVQRIELEADGVALPTLRLTSREFLDLAVDMPAEVVGDGSLDLKLRFPDAVSPRRIGAGSHRGALALFVQSVTLSPQAPPSPK